MPLKIIDTFSQGYGKYEQFALIHIRLFIKFFLIIQLKKTALFFLLKSFAVLQKYVM